MHYFYSLVAIYQEGGNYGNEESKDMSEIFEPLTLEIDDVHYEVVSEPTTDTRENLLSKFKRVIKEDLENMLL